MAGTEDSRGEAGSTPSGGAAGSTPSTPLILIRGEATPDEVAAVVAVVQALASAAASAAPAPKRRSHWADPSRMHRRPLHAGPGGWWASGLPR